MSDPARQDGASSGLHPGGPDPVGPGPGGPDDQGGSGGPGGPALVARGLRRHYPVGDGGELEVLKGVELEVAMGEGVAVVGSSGSGKSTLLHLLGALDRPTAGEILLGGESIADKGSDELARMRNRYVGFVFQFHHLLREFTALENAAMPALVAGRSREEAEARAREILEAVGLASRMSHRPWQLSGGEQQRVAVARALVNDPVLLLADEPSGNLDANTSQGLHDLLFRMRDERNLSMVVVTHNRELARRADRILRVRDGVLVPENA
jgi:lipoprotein-releasing system ATP-binding protein